MWFEFSALALRVPRAWMDEQTGMMKEGGDKGHSKKETLGLGFRA